VPGKPVQPETFDWVKARGECSIENVFQIVCLDIESDVRRRNEHLSKGLTPFNTRYDDRGALVVFRRTRETLRIIRFSPTENGIRVTDDKEKKPIVEATLTLCDDGKSNAVTAGLDVKTVFAQRFGLFLEGPRQIDAFPDQAPNPADVQKVGGIPVRARHGEIAVNRLPVRLSSVMGAEIGADLLQPVSQVAEMIAHKLQLPAPLPFGPSTLRLSDRSLLSRS
jgi:hypothetical protein